MMPNTVLIKFLEVGRNKLSWDVKSSVTHPAAIEQLVRNKRALMSQDITATYTTETTGFISAGFHPVGSFEIHPLS